MANLFKDLDIKGFMKNKPPRDDSFDTNQEIKQLSKTPMNKKFVTEKDDIEATFKKTAKSAGVDYPSGLVKKAMDDSTSPILKLKKHFNRPRPKGVSQKTQHKPRDYRDGFYENAVIPIRSLSSRRVSWRSLGRHVS